MKKIMAIGKDISMTPLTLPPPSKRRDSVVIPEKIEGDGILIDRRTIIEIILSQ
ncbi:MAG: hypothetical protein KKE57_06050 [Proteobacteria bacterium]|nr:hypothetical protein [Pseudomonadota bacterium]